MAADIDRYQAEIERIRKAGDDYKKQNTDFALRNITQLRSFHQHLTSVSLLALAPLFAVLSAKPEMIVSPVFAVLGSILLFGTAAISTIYLNTILTGENNKLGGLRQMSTSTVVEEIGALEKSRADGVPFDDCLSDRLERQKKYALHEQELHRSTIEVDDYADLTTRCFVLGLLMIGLSLV